MEPRSPPRLLALPALAADAFSTDWAPGAKHEARLIAAGGDLAGFEIRLAPGAITYWRDPGDSGLPPTFDFAGSDNVEAVEPLFPAPKRIKEADGGQAFGYDGGVIFPLRVHPRDAAKPVTLALHADFAVCEKVCLPAKARLDLDPAGRRGIALRGGHRRSARRRPARGSAEGFRRAFAHGRRKLAPLRAARSWAAGATCSSSRRKAGG